MPVKGFSGRDVKVLNKNPYVKGVEGSRIIYTDEFKAFYVRNYLKGKRPTAIFVEAGFDPKILGNKRIERASARWRQLYAEGNLKLDVPTMSPRRRGRPRKNPVAVEPAIKRKRGRPRKETATLDHTSLSTALFAESNLDKNMIEAVSKLLGLPEKRRRGRPRKSPAIDGSSNINSILSLLMVSINDLTNEIRDLKTKLIKERLD